MSEDNDDFGTDIDDEEFVALATQAEQQSSARSQEAAPLCLDDSCLSIGFVELDSDDLGESDFVPASRVPVASQGSLRQTTLFSSQAVGSQPAAQQPQRNWPLANSQSNQQPTHHKIDTEAAKTWIYPLNLGFRDYQFNIVHRALLSNLLCALPTGWLSVQF
jgi:ATP-dependent DNA helicase MPH1